LLREHPLLSPSRQADPVQGNPHEGTIVTATPNQMWGTDATATFTDDDGAVTVFAAIDHCTAECVGIHAVKKANRSEALEPIRQGVREHFAAFSADCAAGLKLRHDHGSVYTPFLRHRSTIFRCPPPNTCLVSFTALFSPIFLLTGRSR
jgi:hypothetical protein